MATGVIKLNLEYLCRFAPLTHESSAYCRNSLRLCRPPLTFLNLITDIAERDFLKITMSEYLPAIELLATRSDDFPTPPRNSLAVSRPVIANSSALKNTKSVSGGLSQMPVDVEGGSLERGSIVLIIIVLTGVSFLGSLSNGFLTVGLPRIASDLSLSEHLILWPSAVY